MKQINILLILVLLISLSACGQSPHNMSIVDWETLDENDFSIQYPDDWSLDRSGMAGSSFILFSELKSETDKFGENINLIVQNLEGQNIDLQEFVNISENQIKNLIANSQITESEIKRSKGRRFHSILYSGNQGVFKLVYKQYYWVEEDQAYILTLTCEADQFKNYEEIGTLIMNSFKLK